jgi:predicted house-cleaning noncanonical NTP pyrophosphatase (MazG superfamily)
MAENYEDNKEYKETESDKEIVSFVVGHCDKWRDHRDVNYLQDWDEYERLFRGIWAAEDKMRESERSRIVTPALQQAIEAKQAEISEAVFGRGEFFDIVDDRQDINPSDVELTKQQMHEDFKRSKIKKSLDNIILLGELFGTGIGEITIKDTKVLAPATQPIPGANVAAIGVTEKQQFLVELNPIHPRNFLIEPNARTVDDALGVAVEEYMSFHTLVKGMEDGIYRKCDIAPSYSTTDLERTQEDVNYQDGKLRVIRYYGLVPREYLEQLENEEGEVVDLFPEDSAMDDYADLVEAIVVIADDQHLLKAEANPYMMKDRPIVAYQADSMPGRFWGRGTAEKGYNMQKAVDAQIRAHLDSLALTTAPMMAMDATRLPRGAKYEVKAGRNLLVNGNPNEIMMPFKFGNTDPANMQTAQTFQSMLLQATGTIDSASMPSQVAGGEATGAGLSMALSGLMKKNKRTLINFQEDFLIPFIQKAAWRFMQFDPERYPVQDFVFLPVSSMGMVAREYEQQQMVGLMQTLGNSPITPVLLQGIIKSSSLSNREEIIAQLQAMSQPDPMAQQNQMLEMAAKEAMVQKAQAEAAKAMAETQQIGVETQYIPAEAQAKLLAAASKNTSDPMSEEFEKRMKLMDRVIKVEDIASNERIAELQNRNKVVNI